MRRQIASNVVALYMVQGVQYLLPLIVLPILTRAIGSEGYGTLAFWQSLAAGLGLVVDYGFAYSSVRAVAQTDDSHRRARLLRSTMLAKAVLLAPTSLLLGVIAWATGHAGEWSLLLASWLSLVAAACSPAWYFIATHRNAPVAIMSAGTSALVFVATAAFVRDASSLPAAALILMGLPLAGSLFMLGWLRRHASLPRVATPPTEVFDRLREGLPLFVMALSAGAYSAFNPFLLGLVASPAQVAVYTLGERFSRAARNGLAPLTTVMYPYAASEGSKDVSCSRLFRAGLATFGLSVLCSALLVALAPVAVRLFAGHGFEGAIDTTRMLALNVAAITAGHLVGVQYLVARGREKAVTIVTLLSAPLHIGAFLLAGRAYGALGGAATYVAIECFVTLAFVALAVRHRRTA